MHLGYIVAIVSVSGLVLFFIIGLSQDYLRKRRMQTMATIMLIRLRSEAKHGTTEQSKIRRIVLGMALETACVYAGIKPEELGTSHDELFALQGDPFVELDKLLEEPLENPIER